MQFRYLYYMLENAEQFYRTSLPKENSVTLLSIMFVPSLLFQRTRREEMSKSLCAI